MSNRKLPLSILVGITAAVGPFCVCVCVDILGTKNAEQICFLLNNVIKLGESIDGKLISYVELNVRDLHGFTCKITLAFCLETEQTSNAIIYYRI